MFPFFALRVNLEAKMLSMLSKEEHFLYSEISPLLVYISDLEYHSSQRKAMISC